MSCIVFSVFVLTLGLSEICLTESADLDNVAIIRAEKGKPCVLPCTGLVGPELRALKWRNINQQKVMLLRRGQMVLDGYEDPVYTNRACLQDPEHLNGNLSLVLKKVVHEDSGIYQCQAVYTDGQTTLQHIQLRVRRESTNINTDPDPTLRLFRGLIFGMVSSCLLLLSVVLVLQIYLCRKKTREIPKHSGSGETPASNSKACPDLLVEGKPALDKDEDPEFLGQAFCQRTHSNCSESSNSSEESTSSETALLPSHCEKKPSLDF